MHTPAILFRRTLTRAALVGGLLLLPAAPQAQIVAPAGRTLFNRAVMVRSSVRLDTFDEKIPGVSVRRVVNPYAVVWGATSRLSLSFVAPLVSVTSDSADLPDLDFRTTGLADSSFFARYDWLRRNVSGGYTRLSPEVGLRVPSGGAFGDGSTDPIGALIFSHVRDPHWLIADTQFTYNRRGDRGFREGNNWRYDVAYLRRILPREGLGVPSVLLVLELNGEHARQSRQNGMELPDTGGDLLFLSPGVEWITSNRLVLEFSIPIAVYRDLRGAQMEPQVSLIAGFRWLF